MTFRAERISDNHYSVNHLGRVTAIPAQQSRTAQHLGVYMITQYQELPSQNNNQKPENTGKAARTRFTITGEEIIEKEVRPSGNSGRIYLPLDWVGKHVKIIRID